MSLEQEVEILEKLAVFTTVMDLACVDGKKKLKKHKIRKGLIIKSKWVDKILDGSKTWEIRGSNTKTRGRIGIIQGASSCVVGMCDLVDSFELTEEEYKNGFENHQITDISEFPYKRVYAWKIANPVRFKTPIPYKHPNGAVIWVNLDK